MRITSINFPSSVTDKVKLKPIYMNVQNKVNLIVGKNGAGKTRVLRLIDEYTKLAIKKKQYEDTISEIDRYNAEINRNEESISKIKNKLGASDHNQLLKDIESYNESVERNRRAIKDSQDRIDNAFVKFDEYHNEYKSVYYVPKEIEIDDARTLSDKEKEDVSKKVEIVGTTHLKRGTISKIQILQNRYENSLRNSVNATEEQREQAKEEYFALKSLIKDLLGEELGMNLDGYATLFEKPIADANLSDGQKVLLQLSVALHSQKASLKKIILLLDEPENHLHPSALIELIELLSNKLKDGQIFIATHSINLIAHFPKSSLWFMEDGYITKGGSIPNKVLSGLIGDESRQVKLKDFLSLPSQLAFYQFAHESLFEPEVLPGGQVVDTQTWQVRKELINTLIGDSLKVLDYGAGKGRLLNNIINSDEENVEKITKALDYFAFDEFDAHRDECLEVISNLYKGDAHNRYYSDYNQLLSNHKGQFDIVILCNVLHEVECAKWESMFCVINSLLKPTGQLLIVEVQELIDGEKANGNGFLVLDTEQIKIMFDTDEISVNSERDGWLKSHRISANFIQSVTEKSIYSAIESLKEQALREIIEIRKTTDSDYKTGRKNAFWTMQLANAKIALHQSSHGQ